jgi:hypothetical protein
MGQTRDGTPTRTGCREARSSLPDHETPLSYVKRWERASVGVSERYRMLYARAFSMDEEELFR